VGLVLPRNIRWRFGGESTTDAEGSTRTRGREEVFRGEIDRDVKEMATVGKINDNILGATATMGEV
jgi:hypothetical protein